MKLLVLCVTFNFIFVFNCVYSTVVTPVWDDPANKAVIYSIGHSYKVKCNVSDDPSKKVVIEWKKDGRPISEVESFKDRFDISTQGTVHILSIKSAKEDDVGNFTCYVPDEDGAEVTISAVSKPNLKVPANVNVVEGNKLKIHCNVLGQPPMKITWSYKNDTLNETELYPNDRLDFERDEKKNIDDAILILENVTLWERGIYTCIGSPRAPLDIKQVRAESMVRVKDKYAALWPFLGICAEVLVLCLIILIYEKKRNKTELEESDTDQSPDQKNTPDHNKDSNIRHRQ